MSTFQTFDDFWPFYVREHSNKQNRQLHFVGTTLALGLAAGGLLTKRRWMLLAAPVAGYGFAWAGHYLVEGNKPATFQHPLWSLRADFKMWSMMVRGEMDAEVERVLQSDAVPVQKPTTVQNGADPSVN